MFFVRACIFYQIISWLSFDFNCWYQMILQFKKIYFSISHLLEFSYTMKYMFNYWIVETILVIKTWGKTKLQYNKELPVHVSNLYLKVVIDFSYVYQIYKLISKLFNRIYCQRWAGIQVVVNGAYRC